jgi:hypothetical protein
VETDLQQQEKPKVTIGGHPGRLWCCAQRCLLAAPSHPLRPVLAPGPWDLGLGGLLACGITCQVGALPEGGREEHRGPPKERVMQG